jgi:small subunit ribosomal protein S2
MNGVSIKEMIDAGVHFGHRSKYWNPKMEPYIYTTHKKLHILNLEKSVEHFNLASKYIRILLVIMERLCSLVLNAPHLK